MAEDRMRREGRADQLAATGSLSIGGGATCELSLLWGDERQSAFTAAKLSRVGGACVPRRFRDVHAA
jgi:hypothetical protein